MKTKKTGKPGKPPKVPGSARGKALLTYLNERGHGVTTAARASGVAFSTLHHLVYAEPSPSITLDTFRKLTSGPLKVPAKLLDPEFAKHAS